MKVKNLIVGAGLTGIVLANKIAIDLNQEVLIIEQRNHIGGNCYDYFDENGILIHKYGPHVFHTNYKEVWDFLNIYSEFNDYQHKPLAFVDGKLINIPFNLNSLYLSFESITAEKLEKKLLKYFKYGDSVSVNDLINISSEKNDEDLIFLSDYVYDKIYKNYSFKQWGVEIEKIDKNVLSRVKINISKDDRSSYDIYQGTPKKGYTNMFLKMIDFPNIKVHLNTSFNDIKKEISYDKLFYTGSIDDYFDYKFGELDYRKTKFVFEEYDVDSYQQASRINFPNDYDFTRQVEFKKFYIEKEYIKNKTVILREFPGIGEVKSYPISDKKNNELYDKYLSLLKEKNVYFIGRLGNYKYIDMDQAIKNVFDFFSKNLY